MKYFAYGSNMDETRMRQRGINFSRREFAKLLGYKLVFNKKASKGDYSFANISKDDASTIEGILYEFPDEDLSKLDKAEGYPVHYDRFEAIVADADNKSVKATTYIAQPDRIVAGLFPTKEYLDHLLKGKDILSKAYYKLLITTKTL